MPVLLNEGLYKHKKAIRILTPLPPSGNVITLCIGYCIYFLIFHSPFCRLSSHLSPLLCMHSIFILALNGISFLEIRYQPSCPLLFQPRSEDSSYDPDAAFSALSHPPSPSLTLSLYPLYLNSCVSPPLSSSPQRPHLLFCLTFRLH